MEILNFMGEKHMLKTESDLKAELLAELTRQFGKNDANHFILKPSKYAHQFDDRTLKAYEATKS